MSKAGERSEDYLCDIRKWKRDILNTYLKPKHVRTVDGRQVRFYDIKKVLEVEEFLNRTVIKYKV